SFRPQGLAAKAESLAARIRAAEADLVDLHPFHAGITGLLAACLAGRPALLTFHGPTSLRLPGAEWHRATFERLRLEARPVFVAVSPETRNLIRQAYSGTPLYVLANGVCRGGKALPWDGRTVAMATRLDPDKIPGVLDLLRLLQASPGLTLDLFGGGPALPLVEAQIRTAGLTSRVRVHGHATDPACRFPRRALVAGCGRALLEGLVQGRRGLVVSADAVIAPVTRARFARLADANFSGRGLARTPHREIRAWLHRPCAERVADLVPCDMPERWAAICSATLANADPNRLQAAGQAVLSDLAG
ncbi:MAG: glycosyltransferase, partial [Pseudomonadota bacterium]